MDGARERAGRRSRKQMKDDGSLSGRVKRYAQVGGAVGGLAAASRSRIWACRWTRTVMPESCGRWAV